MLANQGFTFIISIFLARLLEPAEFGLVGMSVAFTGISSIFVNAGFVGALVQNDDNTSVTYSSVFFFNIFVGLLICLFFQAVAPSIANFYEEPKVENIIRYLALVPLISSFNLVQGTILSKKLLFKELTMRRFFSSAVAGVGSVIMAFKGFGVYALVAQALISHTVATFILWRVGDWRPRWEFSFGELRRLTSFSAYMFFNQIVGQVVGRSHALFIGKLFSPATLGFFSKAESLNQLVAKYTANSIGRVFFPAMSQLKNDKKQFVDALLKTLGIISIMVFLLSGWLAIGAEFLIVTLFGEKWLPSVFIFHILIFRVYGAPIGRIISIAFVAYGKAKENFWHGNVRNIIKTSSFVIAFLLGFEAYLYSLVVISFIMVFYNIFIVSRLLDIKIIKIARDIFLCAVILGIGLLPWLLLEIDSLFLETLVGFIAFTLIYVALTAVVCPENFQRFKNLLLSYLQRFRRKIGTSQNA